MSFSEKILVTLRERRNGEWSWQIQAVNCRPLQTILGAGTCGTYEAAAKQAEFFISLGFGSNPPRRVYC